MEARNDVTCKKLGQIVTEMNVLDPGVEGMNRSERRANVRGASVRRSEGECEEERG